MRRYRARNKASGLKEARRWVPRTGPTVFSDHRFHEIRSLMMHALIARKLQRDPRLLAVAERNIRRWTQGRKVARGPLSEWRRVLRRPLPEVLAFITDPGEEATRLRQSSPFAGMLRPAERKRLFDASRA